MRIARRLACPCGASSRLSTLMPQPLYVSNRGWPGLVGGQCIILATLCQTDRILFWLIISAKVH